MGCSCLEPIRCKHCNSFAEYVGTRGEFDAYRCNMCGVYWMRECEIQKEVKRHE